MHETEMKLREICEMKEKFVSWAKEEMGRGKEAVDTKEMGEVIDMIKDLADVEKNCWKACYYKEMTKLLMDCPEDEEDAPMGYDNYRYANGRFAPTGRGHFAGYIRPARDQSRSPGTNWVEMPNSMGYGDGSQSGSQGGSQSSSQGSSGRGGYPMPSRYGYPYDEWNEARRHYTESHGESDKKMMEHKAMEHMTGMVESIQHIWKEADPQLKEKLKKEFKPLKEAMEKEG